ncbi:hypothetical protein ACFE04_012465 [Oxalis oulophora]
METEKSIKDEFGDDSVENVELLFAKNIVQDVPLEYMQTENQDGIVHVDVDALQIPVIDMSKLINHGVDEQVMNKIKEDMAEFFKLPHEEKMICAQLPDDVDGYCVQSKEQKPDIYWRDSLLVTAQPVYSRKIQFWPTTPHSFSLFTLNFFKLCLTLPNSIPRASVDEYSSEVQKVSKCLLRMMAKNLQLDTEKLILSNSEYKSIWHRAVVNKEKERLSIAAFHNPNRKTMIGPLPELMKDDKAAVYKSLTYDEYMSQAFIMIREGKNRLEEMKIRPVN